MSCYPTVTNRKSKKLTIISLKCYGCVSAFHFSKNHTTANDINLGFSYSADDNTQLQKNLIL